MWIPGHSGILGNETADKQAEASLAVNDNKTFLINQMSYDNTKNLINAYKINKLLSIWNTQNTKLNKI